MPLGLIIHSILDLIIPFWTSEREGRPSADASSSLCHSISITGPEHNEAFNNSLYTPLRLRVFVV